MTTEGGAPVHAALAEPTASALRGTTDAAKQRRKLLVPCVRSMFTVCGARLDARDVVVVAGSPRLPDSSSALRIADPDHRIRQTTSNIGH